MRDALDGVQFTFSLLRPGRRKARDFAAGVLDPAALIDLCLILFFWFLINGSYVIKQPGIRIQLPVADQVDPIPFSAMVVTIASEGLVFFNDERTTLDGLQADFRQMAFEYPDRTLLIKADELVPNRTLSKLINDARSVGIQNIALAVSLEAPVLGAESDLELIPPVAP